MTAEHEAQLAAVSMMGVRGVETEALAEYFYRCIRNANTRDAYMRAVRGFARFLDGRALQDVEASHVRAYLEEFRARKAPGTVNQALAAIRGLFSWLCPQGMITVDPTSGIKGVRRTQSAATVITLPVLQRILASPDTSTASGLRDHALLHVMAFAWVRASTLIGMQGQDVITEGGTVTLRVREGGMVRHVPLHATAWQALRAYLEVYQPGPEQPLWSTCSHRGRVLTGRPMARADLFRMVRRRGISARVPTASPHRLRAAGIALFLAADGPIGAAQALAGHLSPITTLRYMPPPQRTESTSLRFLDCIGGHHGESSTATPVQRSGSVDPPC